jgi:hypothetical protein
MRGNSNQSPTVAFSSVEIAVWERLAATQKPALPAGTPWTLRDAVRAMAKLADFGAGRATASRVPTRDGGSIGRDSGSLGGSRCPTIPRNIGPAGTRRGPRRAFRMPYISAPIVTRHCLCEPF